MGIAYKLMHGGVGREYKLMQRNSIVGRVYKLMNWETAWG